MPTSSRSWMARVDALGQPVQAVPALSFGAGLRFIWTRLASLVPRGVLVLDASTGALLLHFLSWFFTFGLLEELLRKTTRLIAARGNADGFVVVA